MAPDGLIFSLVHVVQLFLMFLCNQERLAELVDVTRQTILFLEKGKYNPSLRLA